MTNLYYYQLFPSKSKKSWAGTPIILFNHVYAYVWYSVVEMYLTHVANTSIIEK